MSPLIICAWDYSYYIWSCSLTCVTPCPIPRYTRALFLHVCLYYLCYLSPWPRPGLTWGLRYSALWALKRLITWACRRYLRVARGNVTLACFCCFWSTFDPGIVSPSLPSPHDKHILISTTSPFLFPHTSLSSFLSFREGRLTSPSSCSLAPLALNWYKWR